MTSVGRMASAIAGVFLNHRFLKHIPCTGYLSPSKVLALAYIFCNTKGTETLNFLRTKRKKNHFSVSLPFHQPHCFSFPLHYSCEFNILIRFETRQPASGWIGVSCVFICCCWHFFTEFICYKPILTSEGFIESLSQYLPYHRLKYNRIPSTVRKRYLSTWQGFPGL